MGFVKDNKSLGNFRLAGLPPAPRGVPQIEVKFDIDANGILSVTATDKGSGKKADIKITGASTLANEDVDRMVQEAEKYAEEDKLKREEIDVKNQSDSMVYQTSKQLSEFGDKLVKDPQDEVTKKGNDLEEAIKSGEITKMKTSMESLQQEVRKRGQAMYNQQDAGSSTQQKTNNPSTEQKPQTNNDFTDKN